MKEISKHPTTDVNCYPDKGLWLWNLSMNIFDMTDEIHFQSQWQTWARIPSGFAEYFKAASNDRNIHSQPSVYMQPLPFGHSRSNGNILSWNCSPIAPPWFWISIKTNMWCVKSFNIMSSFRVFFLKILIKSFIFCLITTNGWCLEWRRNSNTQNSQALGYSNWAMSTYKTWLLTA